MTNRRNIFIMALQALAIIVIAVLAAAIAIYVFAEQPTSVATAGAAGLGGLMGSLLLPLLDTVFSPFWHRHINAPKLQVVIDGITRTLSAAAEETLLDDPELAVLNIPLEWTGDISYMPVEPDKPGSNLCNLEKRLIAAKLRLHDVKDEIERLESLKLKVDSHNPVKEENSGEEKFDKIDDDGHIEFVRLNAKLPRSLQIYATEEIDVPNWSKLAKHYHIYITWLQYLNKELSNNLPEAETKLSSIKFNLERNCSIFTVFATLINTGGSASTTRAPALLRVSIAPDSDIDLKLSSQDRTNIIKANEAVAVTFSSHEIKTMEEEDQERINNFWGKGNSSFLYLEDIKFRICKSNEVAFAPGLCQKSIYDRLARRANRHFR